MDIERLITPFLRKDVYKRQTMQKGPEYFVEAAAMVLHRTRNIRFVMAGSGDMMDQMIRLVAERGIADRFHFPGFMKGSQVYEMLKACLLYTSRYIKHKYSPVLISC